MTTRLDLHSLLKTTTGLTNLYYQPGPEIKMVYPCLRYNLTALDVQHSDNIKYRNHKRYTITVLDKDPDSLIPDKILSLPYTSLDTTYRTDNLNHFVITIYF